MREPRYYSADMRDLQHNDFGQIRRFKRRFAPPLQGMVIAGLTPKRGLEGFIFTYICKNTATKS